MDHLHWLYSISGTILTLFYIPQIITVYRAKTDLKDISILTWGTWAGCMVCSTLYAALIMKDFKVTLFQAVGTICCLVVTVITAHKRVRYKIKSLV